MAEENDHDRRRREPGVPDPKKAIPAAVFAVGILVVVFLVFALITWARYHD